MGRGQIEWSEKRSRRRWLMSYRRPEELLRRFRRWTVGLSVAFALSVIALVPIADRDFLNGYWQTVRSALIFVSMGLLLWTAFAGVITYDLWSYLRAIRRLECDNPKTHRSGWLRSRTWCRISSFSPKLWFPFQMALCTLVPPEQARQ